MDPAPPASTSHLAASHADLDRFLNELVLAWKKLAAYPAGHPLREGAVASAFRELKALLSHGRPLALGVAREGLSWGDQRLSTPGIRQIAEVLYQANVAVLRFTSAVREGELEAFLLALRGRSDELGPEGLARRLTAAAIGNIEIKRADFSLLKATDELAPREAPRLDLWDRILRWHLEGKPELAAALGKGDLATVLQWVRDSQGSNADARSAARASEVLRVLSGAIAADLQASALAGSGSERVRQVSELILAVPAGLREALLDAALTELLGDGGDPASLVALANQVSPAATVRALGRLRAEGARLPALAAGLIEKLATTLGEPAEAALPGAAQPGSFVPPQRADPATLDRRIFDRPEELFLAIPPAVEGGLVEGSSSGGFDGELASLEPLASLQRLAQRLLALLSSQRLDGGLDGVACRLEEAYTTLLALGHHGAAYALALEIASLAGRGGRASAAQQAFARLAGERATNVLAGRLRRSSDGELQPLHLLVEKLGPEPVRRLLVALGEAEDRAVRRSLFNFLQGHPGLVSEVAPEVLGDRRWFVVRNVLSLLNTIGGRRAADIARPSLQHPDPRVRAEALKLCSKLGAHELGGELLSMFADPDERVVRLAIRLAGESKARAAVGPLLAILRPLDLQGRDREVRLLALRSLGEIGDPNALDELKRFFTGVPPFVHAEERRAAYQSLAGYPSAAREPWVQRGLRSRDAETVEACRALLGAEGA